eukprot:COSAG06_NODE_4197_length_4485_cov_7.345645_6_plen_93_part_00
MTRCGKNAFFCGAVFRKKRSIYQDRLGTNIWEWLVEKKAGVFSQELCVGNVRIHWPMGAAGFCAADQPRCVRVVVGRHDDGKHNALPPTGRA